MQRSRRRAAVHLLRTAVFGMSLAAGYVSAEDTDVAASIVAHERACDAGEADACMKAGRELGRSDTPRRDVLRALQLYVRACELGIADGCQFAGAALMFGDVDGIQMDPPAARPLLARGCELGQHQACNNLGLLLDGRLDVPVTGEEVIAAFQKGCDLGNPRACGNLGKFLQRSSPSPDDLSRAVVLFRRGCHGRSPIACEGLANALYEGRGVEKRCAPAVDLASAWCDFGHGPACSAAARMLREGDCSARDLVRAFHFGARACALEHGEGCWHAGLTIRDGPQPNHERMLRWFLKGCELGNDPACASWAYGVLKQNPNDEDAVSLLLRQCRARRVVSCSEALRWSASPRLKEVVPLALEVSRAACAQAFTNGCAAVGLAYEKGASGSPDLSEALIFYEKACQLGDEWSCSRAVALRKSSPKSSR